MTPEQATKAYENACLEVRKRKKEYDQASERSTEANAAWRAADEIKQFAARDLLAVVGGEDQVPSFIPIPLRNG